MAKKEKSSIKKPFFKKWWFWVIVVVIVFGAFGSGGSKSKKQEEAETVTDSQEKEQTAPVESVEKTDNTEETEPQNTGVEADVTESSENEESSDELTQLKAELKEKYDVSEPSSFVRGDNTGKWRIVKVANATAPSDYAVDYARAYMQDGDVHYVVNFSLNTTTQFRLIAGKLSAITTEYVEKEEHDASIIGQGMLYTEKYFDMETGEEITTEADESAGTVDNDELISAVRTAIEGQVGEGEVITDVTFDGSNLTVKVDLSGADTSILSANLIAESRVSSITDSILELDDSFYNTWETITVDFGEVGSATFDKSMVKDEGFGKFFDVPVGIFD